jgi:DNA-directed RNA polymerase subunit K/omega
MIKRPDAIGRFEFAVLSSLRAAQLLRGCVPLVDVGIHKIVTTAQEEVARHKVERAPAPNSTEIVSVLSWPVAALLA